MKKMDRVPDFLKPKVGAWDGGFGMRVWKLEVKGTGFAFYCVLQEAKGRFNQRASGLQGAFPKDFSGY